MSLTRIAASLRASVIFRLSVNTEAYIRQGNRVKKLSTWGF